MQLRALTASFATALAGICLATSAHADSASASFTEHLAPGGPSIGAQATFTLNANGSISADVQSFAGGLEGFGFNSASHDVSHDFSVAGPNDTSWGTSFGNFKSGWYDFSSSPTKEDWTIGSAGQFTSVMQLFTPNASGYELFVLTKTDQWAATAAVAAVPEPGTYALMLAGIGCIAWVARRRQS